MKKVTSCSVVRELALSLKKDWLYYEGQKPDLTKHGYQLYDSYWDDKKKSFRDDLFKFDLENATDQEIKDFFIQHKMFNDIKCNECQKSIETAIEIDNMDLEIVYLCSDCLKKGLSLLGSIV